MARGEAVPRSPRQRGGQRADRYGIADRVDLDDLVPADREREEHDRAPSHDDDGLRPTVDQRRDDRPVLAALVVAIAEINAWNRLKVVSRQVTAEGVARWVA